jgi:hypothetical protein
LDSWFFSSSEFVIVAVAEVVLAVVAVDHGVAAVAVVLAVEAHQDHGSY